VKKWKPDDNPDVLRHKLNEAQALVDWYEQKVQRLSLAAHNGIIKCVNSAELRREVEAAIESFCSRGHASSLIDADRKAMESQLGAKFQRRHGDISAAWA